MHLEIPKVFARTTKRSQLPLILEYKAVASYHNFRACSSVPDVILTRQTVYKVWAYLQKGMKPELKMSDAKDSISDGPVVLTQVK